MPVNQKNEPQLSVNREEDVCPKCGGQLWRDEHPDGVAVGSWNCSNCDWYQEIVINSITQVDLPF